MIWNWMLKEIDKEHSSVEDKTNNQSSDTIPVEDKDKEETSV